VAGGGRPPPRTVQKLIVTLHTHKNLCAGVVMGKVIFF
jgi:hypothetical protein